MGYSGFQSSSVVTNPSRLFGHNEPDALLDQLTHHTTNGINTQIVGEHRTGKTSLLRCAIKRIAANFPQLVPVYINYKEHHEVNGSAETVSLLLATIHACVSSHSHSQLPPLLEINGTILRKSGEISDHFEQIKALEKSYKVDALTREYVLKLLPSYGTGVILFIDEYEQMLLRNLNGNPGTFFFLRELSAEPRSNASHPKPFTMAIAGATSWDQLCNVIGSPELNNVVQMLPIGAIGSEPFKNMWLACLDDSSDDTRKQIASLDLAPHEIYEMTGGWPFFGKVLGDQVAGAQYVGDAIYEALLPHFNVLWSRRSSSERIALHTRNRNTLQFGALRDLVNRGLAVDQDDSIAPRGTLWAKYIDEQTIAEEVSVASQQGLLDVAKEKLRMVVEQIGNLVFEINQANQGIKQPEIFVATTQTWKIYQDLKKPALNADGFSIFSQAAYRLIFDSTTGERENRQRALERLPKSFRRDNRIVRVVDCIRHHSGGHLTDLSTFANNGMAISEVFSLYLKRVDAPLDEEYIDLQLAILEDLVSYLSDLKNSLRKRFQSQP